MLLLREELCLTMPDKRDASVHLMSIGRCAAFMCVSRAAHIGGVLSRRQQCCATTRCAAHLPR